jgi:hypothetical protein
VGLAAEAQAALRAHVETAETETAAVPQPSS